MYALGGARVYQFQYRMMARLNGSRGTQRGIQPTAQQPAAHGGGAMIHRGVERVFLAAIKAGVYFQIAARIGIKFEPFTGAFPAQ